MLTLTRKTDYALIALSHLACSGGRVVSAREIAVQYKMPLALLMNLLKLCAASGLVESVRGARGGYRLGRPADRIALVELVEAIEGPLKTHCKGLPRASDPNEQVTCQVGHGCPVRIAINSVHARLQGLLAEMTLADVVRMAAEAAAKALGPRAGTQAGAPAEVYKDEAASLSGQ